MVDTNTNNYLSDLYQKLAFLRGGGAEESSLDKLNRVFGTLSSGAKNVMDIRKTQADIINKALESKKAQLEQKKVGDIYGVPSAQKQAGQNRLIQAGNQPVQGPPNLIEQPPIQTPGGVDENGIPYPPRSTSNAPMFVPPTQPSAQPPITAREDFLKKTNIPPETPMFQVTDMVKVAALQQTGDAVYIHPTDKTAPPIIQPETATPPSGYLLIGKVPEKQGASLAVANANANRTVPVISAEQGLKQGQTPKGTIIPSISQTGQSPYADVRAAQYIAQDLPSNMSPTTASGAASQVQLAVRQGKGLIANPGSPQRLALAASDLARAVQRSAPQLETLEGAGFANNLSSRLSLLAQKVTANPNSADVPKLRKEVYDILDDLDRTSKPIIQRQLDVIEGIYKERLPGNWNEIKKGQLGENIPDIPYNEVLSAKVYKNPVEVGLDYKNGVLTKEQAAGIINAQFNKR